MVYFMLLTVLCVIILSFFVVINSFSLSCGRNDRIFYFRQQAFPRHNVARRSGRKGAWWNPQTNHKISSVGLHSASNFDVAACLHPSLDIKTLQEILETAERAAISAGQIISDNLGCCSELQGQDECLIKSSIKDIVTQYDQRAQSIIKGIIQQKYPNHGFLGEEDVDPGGVASEEALDDILNSANDFIWICDPIDGTANFATGLRLCAVTLGVVYNRIPIVGVVYDPHSREMFSAILDQGATVKRYDDKGMVLQEELMEVSTSVVDIKDAIINAGCPADPNAFETSIRGVRALNGKSRGIRMIACSALTTAWIASGRLTAHFGYDLSSWDLVAGALLIKEAGGLVTDLDGTSYQLTTRNMLCSNGNKNVHNQILEVLKNADAIDFNRAESSS